MQDKMSQFGITNDDCGYQQGSYALYCWPCLPHWRHLLDPNTTWTRDHLKARHVAARPDSWGYRGVEAINTCKCACTQPHQLLHLQHLLHLDKLSVLPLKPLPTAPATPARQPATPKPAKPTPAAPAPTPVLRQSQWTIVAPNMPDHREVACSLMLLLTWTAHWLCFWATTTRSQPWWCDCLTWRQPWWCVVPAHRPSVTMWLSHKKSTVTM